jgi:hypothetical protein
MILWSELVVNRLRGPFLVGAEILLRIPNKYQVLIQDAIRLWSNRNEPVIHCRLSSSVIALNFWPMTQAESGALEADYEFARQSLVAAVARAYFSTIEASQQKTNARSVPRRRAS